MKNIFWALAIVTCIVLSPFTANANSIAPTQSTANVQIPDNIKSISELGDYLYQKGIVTNFDEFKTFLENNKATIRRINPKTIDYGFTYRLYTETNTPFRDDGLIRITHEYGIKEANLWVIPIIISNNSKEKIEISKENFALVPRYIPAGSELNVLALEPEYIMDGSAEVQYRKILGKFELPPNREVHLNAVFYVSPITTDQNVNLRIYDGNDHTDVNIVKK
ncbi:hypothetical protein [Brevibacillus reuszeri]|uniref:hypothetical protein n=1 Tax=Brevibacillus reuszeri TaxID=54915 RepID=UPI000CCC69AE|nr:hypothetical protein [Brevibacillus reuszeri]